ncbi:hypothetical protein JCM12856_25220 [Spirochaeta dissipatitropha]
MISAAACSVALNTENGNSQNNYRNSVEQQVLHSRISPSAAASVLMSEEDSESSASQSEIAALTTAIPLPRDHLVVAVKDYNLNQDEMDEQIIAYKIQGDESDRIHILLLDYDFIRGAYVTSWHAVTQGTQNRSVKIDTLDTNGNGFSEILVYGIDNQGRQTLDVFTADQNITGPGLQFRNVFNIAVDGTIDVLESGDDLRSTYSISIQRQDQSSTNIMDLVQESYHWDTGAAEFNLSSRRRIPGIEIEESQLQQLYAGDSHAFEQFLSGPWYRSRGGNIEDPDVVFISFFPEEREMIFFNDEFQQVFTWDTSTRTIYRNIRIDLRNQIMPSISTFGSVAVIGMDTIRVQLQNNDDWNGDYRRISGNLQSSLFGRSKAAALLAASELQGLFLGENDVELFFDRSSFTLQLEDRKLQGGYSSYAFDDHILIELQATSNFGILQDRLLYSVEIETQTSNDRVIRRLIMQPARIFSHGVQIIGTEGLRLEQIIERIE